MSLIEVMVSALLVVVASLAVFAGLDGASATSGANKKLSIAADLAQGDQERLRGQKVATLSNLRETRTRIAAGVTYTITSRADWVTDSSGTVSCQSGSASADYLQITSTVTWPNMIRVRPVTVHSIIAPPNGSFGEDTGSLAVEVLDRDGNGVAGLPVTISGPAGLSDSTNSLGCAFFGYIPAGSGYTIAFSKPGYVDRQGNNLISIPASVTAEAVNTVPVDYDLAANIAVTFDSAVAQFILPNEEAHWVTIENSGLTAGTRVYGNGTPVTSMTLSNLFPFNEGYTVYSGNCAGARPPAGAPWPGPVGLDPGENASITLREPNLNLQAKRPNSNNLPNARVKLTPKSAGCTDVLTFSGSGSDGALTAGPTTPGLAGGRLPKAGVPYGTYDVCVDDGVRKGPVVVDRAVTDHAPPLGPVAGPPAHPLTVTVPTSGTGTC